MFSTFLKELGGYFDRRWLVSSFFPSLAFWSVWLLIYGLSRGPGSTLKLWQSQSAEVQVIATVAALSGVTFFAYLLSNLQTGLIRLFEGYWEHRPLSWLRGLRLGYYRKQYLYLKYSIQALSNDLPRREADLRDPAAAGHEAALAESWKLNAYEREWFLFYPFQLERVMPTRLGNIIRAAELYALGRYGIDAVVIWPRLYPYLPAAFVNELLDVKTSMTFMLVMSALSFAVAVVSSVLITFVVANWPLSIACALGFLLAWLCYRNSLHSARLYAELIKTAFDLYRRDLLKALHIKPPDSYEREIKIWEDIAHLIARNEELTFAVYEGENKEASAAEGEQPGPLVAFVRDLRQALDEVSRWDAEPAAPQPPQPPQPPGAPEQPATETVPGTTATEAVSGATGAALGAPPPPPAPRPVERQQDYFGPAYFGLAFFLCLIMAVVTYQAMPPKVTVPALSHDVPAYHLITERDLIDKTVEPSQLQGDHVKDAKNIIGRYTSKPLKQASLIGRGELRELARADLLDEAVIVGIPATPAMVWGGDLRAGDLINIKFLPGGQSRDAAPAAGGPTQPAAVEIQNVLVLDVKNVAKENLPAVERVEYPFVLVVAVPKGVDPDFVNSSARSSLTTYRKLPVQ